MSMADEDVDVDTAFECQRLVLRKTEARLVDQMNHHGETVLHHIFCILSDRGIKIEAW